MSRARSLIELHRPSVEFWIMPADQPGEWITVSRYDGKLHVRGTYVDATPQAVKLARIAYEAMEAGLKSVGFSLRGLLVRVKS